MPDDLTSEEIEEAVREFATDCRDKGILADEGSLSPVDIVSRDLTKAGRVLLAMLDIPAKTSGGVDTGSIWQQNLRYQQLRAAYRALQGREDAEA